MPRFRQLLRGQPKARPIRRRNKARLGLEELESRVVLYSASGNAWPNPQLITISFMPDGTNLGGGVTSNLHVQLQQQVEPGRLGEHHSPGRAGLGPADQHQLRRRPRRRRGRGSGADEQGNPGFGDIRIGGYNFGSSTLALTYQPPPANNFSIAGDDDVQHGPVVQRRFDLRPVHRGHARVRPRARAERKQRQQLP